MTDSVPRSKQDWLLLVGLFCFFFSGAAGLIYQVVWTRMLTQIFGNTTYAIATVLSAFMAGLAIGSYLFGQIADRGKNDFLLVWHPRSGRRRLRFPGAVDFSDGTKGLRADLRFE